MLPKEHYTGRTDKRCALDFTRSTPRPRVANRLVILALILTGLAGVLTSLGAMSL